MALFKRKSSGAEKTATDKKKVAKATKKKSGGLFGKKETTPTFDANAGLIEQLRLEPSVADAVAETLSDFAESGDNPLVKQTGGFYDVLVVTEPELAAAFDELDEDEVDTALGDLSAKLSNDTIANATTDEDLVENQLVIIPNDETLSELADSSVMSRVKYHIGHFPVDGEMNEEAVAFDEALLSLGDLMQRLDAAAGNDVAVDDYDDEEVDFDEDDYDSDNIGLDAMDEDVEDDPAYDELDDEDDVELDFGDDDDDSFDNFDFKTGSDADDDDSSDFESLFDSDDDDDDAMLEDEDETDDEVVAGLDDEATDIESQADSFVRAKARVISGSDLELHVDTDRFNETFIEQPVILFTLEKDTDSELQKTLNGMKLDANTKLLEARKNTRQRLLNVFNEATSTMAGYIQKKFSYTNSESTFAQAKTVLETSRERSLEELAPTVEEQRELAEKRYMADRERVLRPQFELLTQQYDAEHAAEKQASIREAELSVTTKIDEDFKKSLIDLEARRQDDAQQAYNKVVNALIKQLQDQYEADSQAEREIYDEAQAKFDKFLQENYIRETQRVEGLREQAREESQAEKIRRELQATIDSLQASMETANKVHETELAELKRETQKLRMEKDVAVQETTKHFEQQLAMAQKTNDALAKANQQLSDGKASFKSRPSKGASDEKQTPVVPTKKKVNKAVVAGTVGAGLLVVGGGAVIANQVAQNNQLTAQVAKVSDNYESLNKKYVTLSRSNQKTKSELKKATQDATPKTLLNNENSIVAKSTNEGSTDTIRVAKSDNYDVGQTVTVATGDTEGFGKVSNVDTNNHTVTVHVDSSNEDFQFQY